MFYSLFLFLILFSNLKFSQSGENCEPLILTPFIESGRLGEARQLSRVIGLPNAPILESYSGFLTVNKRYNSNIFFWFFPSANSSAPVLLWLQGGPGSSSLFGLFVINGPFTVNKELNVSLKNYSWAQEFSMLYIDNPIGSGFSFTENSDGFSRNETSVGDNLYEALQQFYTLFNEYRKNEFYITGESYAGKYIPAIGYKLHVMANQSNINFKGIAIGNGWIDPINFLDIASFLLQIGLIDEKQAQKLYSYQNQTAEAMASKNFRRAFEINDEYLGGDLINTTTYFHNVTGLNYYLNYLLTNSPEDFDYYEEYMKLNATLNALHVGCRSFSDYNHTVEMYLIEDVFDSVKPWFTTIIDNYKVLIYSGMLDIIVATTLTENFLKNLEWKYSKELAETERLIWKVSNNDTEVAGYVKQVANFTFVTIRNAGHIVPYDQPRAAKDMINNFIYSQKFNAIN